MTQLVPNHSFKQMLLTMSLEVGKFKLKNTLLFDNKDSSDVNDDSQSHDEDNENEYSNDEYNENESSNDGDKNELSEEEDDDKTEMFELKRTEMRTENLREKINNQESLNDKERKHLKEIIEEYSYFFDKDSKKTIIDGLNEVKESAKESQEELASQSLANRKYKEELDGHHQYYLGGKNPETSDETKINTSDDVNVDNDG